MNKKELLEQTSVLAKYYKYIKNSKTTGDNATLYIAARNFNEAHRDLVEHCPETDDGIKPQPIGPSGALQLLYVLSKYVQKNHPGEWDKIK